MDSESDSSAGVGVDKWTFFAPGGRGLPSDMLPSLDPRFSILCVITSSGLGMGAATLCFARMSIPLRGMFRLVEARLLAALEVSVNWGGR